MSALEGFACPPEHMHGATSTCYNHHRCRCEGCCVAYRSRARARHRSKAYGQWVDPFVPSDPVRAHVLRLQEFGIGLARTAELAGVPAATVHRLVYGRNTVEHRGEESRRILRTSADAILAVRADLTSLAPLRRIPGRGVRRRVHALMAIGWSQAQLAAAIGEDQQNFSRALQLEQVTVRRHLLVADVYERLSLQRPPLGTPGEKGAASRSMITARRNGWPPPAAWDDIDEDESPAIPDEPVEVDEVAVELAIEGRDVTLRPAERLEAVRLMNARGLPDKAIAERLRLSSDAIQKIRTRTQIPAAVGSDRERIVA